MRRRGFVLGIGILAFLGALALPALPAASADEADIEKMIQNAKTAVDHQAIADYYAREAAAAKAKADLHRKMGEDYKKAGGALAGKTHFHEHCEALVRSFESLAKDYAALAEAHQKMAASAK